MVDNMDEELKILLLEYSSYDAGLIDIELRKAGFLFNLRIVETENDFLNALKRFEPDLILADYTLPSYDGLSALLSTRERYFDIPFIFVSGTTGKQKSIDIMRNGATDYVFKDNLSKLGPAVTRALSERDELKKRLTAEKRLKESANQWKSTFDAIDDAISLLSAKGEILRCNKAMARFLNKTFVEIIGSTCWELVHKTDKPIPECPVVRMRKTRQRETMIMPANGKILQITVDPILDEKGDIFQIVHIISDITEQKQAEGRLLESEEKYRVLFKSASDTVLLVNAETMRILDANEAAVELYGYTYKELLRINVMDLSAETKKTTKALQDNFSTYIPIRYHRKKDGRIFPVEITANFLKLKNKKIHISNIRDISERIKTEKENKSLESKLHQSQKMESIGILAGGIAHDFNNILTSIIGFAQIALDDFDKKSDLEDDIQEILTAGLRAKDLVRQILTIARQSHEEISPLRVDSIAKEVVKFIRSSIPTTIEIKSKICSKSLIMGNSTQIHQIFMNLFTNAAHAMEKDGGILEVALEDFQAEERTVIKYPNLQLGSYIKITVSDTGAGIPQEVINFIFEPYFTTKKQGEGTGLGLAMVHGIIASYGGMITVSSELKKGSVFTIYLPVTEKFENLDSQESGNLPKGTERILFVDDESPIVKLNKKIFEDLGYHVTGFTNSVEALEHFQSKSKDFDIAITDMTMPKLTGDNLARAIGDIRPELPIILCTGYSKKLSANPVEDHNIKAVLKKPIPKSDLVKIVRQVLDKAKNNGV
jgi:PAS domain S-box-containing protein